MSWPDEYFHSQLLTVEVTDPSVFAYSGALVAASAYEVAAAGAEEAYWLAHWIYARSAARLYRERQSRLWIGKLPEGTPGCASGWNFSAGAIAKPFVSLGALVSAEDGQSVQMEVAALQQRLVAVENDILAGGL